MNKALPWIIAAFAGFLIVFLLNTSPLSRVGVSVDLPFGWRDAPVQLVKDCNDEEGKDPNASHCAGTCPIQVRNDEGIPFAGTRENRTNRCYQDSNKTAVILNYIFGAVSGVILLYIVEKSWAGKQKE